MPYCVIQKDPFGFIIFTYNVVLRMKTINDTYMLVKKNPHTLINIHTMPECHNTVLYLCATVIDFCDFMVSSCESTGYHLCLCPGARPLVPVDSPNTKLLTSASEGNDTEC